MAVAPSAKVKPDFLLTGQAKKAFFSDFQ